MKTTWNLSVATLPLPKKSVRCIESCPYRIEIHLSAIIQPAYEDLLRLAMFLIWFSAMLFLPFPLLVSLASFQFFMHAPYPRTLPAPLPSSPPQDFCTSSLSALSGTFLLILLMSVQ